METTLIMGYMGDYRVCIGVIVISKLLASILRILHSYREVVDIIVLFVSP